MFVGVGQHGSERVFCPTACSVHPRLAFRHAETGIIVTTGAIDQGETKRIRREELESYFDAFTRHFLMHESTTAADVELVAPDWGDQFAAEGAHLRGITYDPKDNAIEFALEGFNHFIPDPREVWVIEELDGFVRAVEVIMSSGACQIARVRRLGVAPRESERTDVGRGKR